MYVIKCDDYVLSDPRFKNLFVSNPKLNLEVNKNGSLDFTIYPNHPYYDKLKRLKSIITVYQDNIIIFKGRIIDDELGFYNEKQVSVEGILGFLLDSVQEPFTYQGTVKDLFIKLITEHNNQVSEFQQLRIGKITINVQDNIEITNNDYITTKKVVEDQLLNKLGGYLRIRYELDGNYIDYLDDFTDTSSQTIEFGKNLISLTQKMDAVNIKTGIIPLGAKIKDSEGKDTNNRLTISSVNNGNNFLLDEAMAFQYGKIFQTVVYDDVTDPNILLENGQNDLLENIKLSNTIELTAVDLNNVDKEIDSFKFCDYINILSTPHKINKSYLLKKMSIDLLNPQNTKITLGETIKTLTDTTTISDRNNNDLRGMVNYIYSDYASEVKVSEIVNEKVDINIIIDSNAVATNKIIDNKKEYVKKINFGVLPSSGEKSVPLGLELSTITVTDIQVIAKDNNNNYIKIPCMFNDNAIELKLSGNDNSIKINVGSIDMSEYSAVVDICYVEN